MTTKGTDNRFRSLTVVGESGTPSTPGTGDFKLYVADDGTFYVMDDTGTPTALGGGGLSDPMTTRGDIIIRNASNVTARLGLGSSGQVLTSDGTDIAWQTPAAGGSFHGCALYMDATQSVTNAVVTWPAEEFDTDGYHSTSSNTSRITIPSSLGGKYLFTATIYDISGGNQSHFRKNGAVMNGPSFNSTGSFQACNGSMIVDVSVGDYIEVYVAASGHTIYGSGSANESISRFQCVKLG